jgi:hypothetical protein
MLRHHIAGGVAAATACALALSLASAGASRAGRPTVAQTRLEASAYIGVPHKGPVDVQRGERTAASQRALGKGRFGAQATIPETGDPVAGTFSPVLDWPLVGIHAVLLPDGRVLTYGTDLDGAQTGYFVYDVWDPRFGLGAESHTVLENFTEVDIFCGTQLVLTDGKVGLFGGDITGANGRSINSPVADVTQFDPADDSLVRVGAMWRPRWYASSTMLPNGEVLIQGGDGGRDRPEVRAIDGSFRLLTGANTFHINWFYPRNFVAPGGRIFGIAWRRMYRIDPAGSGSVELLDMFTGDNVGPSSTAVMFAPGLVLQVGGGNDIDNASADASIIDIRGERPVVTPVAPMSYGRHWVNSTVLADGRVFVSGGSMVKNARKRVAYRSELYDPATGTWALGATAARMRLYHSTSLLLPDATVLTAGGGAPGPQLNLNAEIYYPPYLFDANGNRAMRPRITSAPMTASTGELLALASPDAASIARVTLVKAGSVTHSFDMDQRFITLDMTKSREVVHARLPASSDITPPGNYMVFLINHDGVPSEAAMLRIAPL